MFGEQREAVSTFTDVNVRAVLVEPHTEQQGESPSEYSEIEARTSNPSLQSRHTYSYLGTSDI